MAPEANRFNSFLRILENAISSGNKQRNKQTSVHRYNVFIFHSSSPGESVPAFAVLIDV